MKLEITLESEKEIKLPRNYNHIVQGWLYNQISDPAYRAFVHERGYSYEKRRFKLFTFSRLHGQWVLDAEKKHMIFHGPVTMFVASPLMPLMEEIATTLLMGLPTRLGTNQVVVTAIRGSGMELLSPEMNKWRVAALSPIVTYSTIINEGKKETRYYRPDEPEFNELIKANLWKKSQVLQEAGLIEYWPLGDKFQIRPLFDPGRSNSTALYYKGFFIRGYMGVYELECDATWLRIALDTGLGSKNAQGLGMVERV